MKDIYINNRVRLDRFGLRVRDFSNCLAQLHKKQGDIDGACVVYSVIMSLLCLGYISEDDISVGDNVARNKVKKDNKCIFLDHLLKDQGFIREGYFLSTMAKEIRTYLPDLTVRYHKKRERFLEYIFEYVEEDNPVVVTVANRHMNHAVLVIGVEYDEDYNVVKLFCLDPGEPLNEISYWNCIIDTSKGLKNDSLSWYLTTSITSQVEIKEVLAIE